MSLLAIYSQFPDQEACIEHIESIRFGDEPYCPHCGSVEVARKADGYRVGRWNCHACKSSFNALSGTVFSKTKVPLQKWFMAIQIMVNAKKSLSSCQLARDLDLTFPTARYVMHRIRAAMLTEEGSLLHGVVEADETYVGGKPRKGNRRSDDTPGPRGRATSKTPVIGAVERGGRVAAEVAGSLKGPSVLRFIQSNVDPDGSLLITDEFTGYRGVRDFMPHAVIKHAEQYVDGETHTNTIEGFWSLLKRAWYGSHHHYSKRWMPLYIAEATWKYNHRKSGDAFSGFMRECFAL